MTRIITTAVALLATAIGHAQVDISDVIKSDRKQEILRNSDGGGELASTLGPIIAQFQAIPGCPYPNAERRILRYRVNPSPDGARVQNVAINYEYAGGPAGTIFASPSSSTSAIQTAGEIKDGRRNPDYLQTTAFILSATDSKGRSSTRRLEYRYLDPEPVLQYTGIANPPREIRTPEGTLYEYAFNISVDNLSIVSIDAPDRFYLYRDGRSDTAPVSSVQLWEEYNAGGRRRALARPSQRFERGERLVLTLRTPVANYIVYRGRSYDSWAAPVRLGIRHPRGCAIDPQTVSVQVPARRADPAPRPAPEPEPTPEPYYNAYRSEVACDCTDEYTNARLTVQGCMLDERSAPRMCSAAARTFKSKRTECVWVPGAYRRISTVMDCNDINPAPVVTNIDDGRD